MNSCMTCGQSIPSDVNFCSGCGAPVPNAHISREDLDVSAPNPSGYARPKTGVGTKVIVSVAVCIGLGLTAAIFTFVGSSEDKFQAAVDGCLNVREDGYFDIQVADDGRSMYLDGSGQEDSSSLEFSSQLCVLTSLGVPKIVLARMNSTSSLMGAQESDWDGIAAIWTYHPDNGLDISLTKK